MEDALMEVDASISRIYTYAAWADKFDGAVHSTVQRYITLAMYERMGVMAVICPSESPLLSFISTVFPCLAMGNCVVAVPSEAYPTLALEMYQILETSDLPGGAINMITGDVRTLGRELAGHADVDGIWYFGSREGAVEIETLSADNLKRTWMHYNHYRDWMNPEHGEGVEFLLHATEVKNIWVPYGA
jgi:aldehyde dehydrogenase (NAD+)